MREPDAGLSIHTSVQYKDHAIDGSGFKTHVQVLTQSVGGFDQG